MDEAKGILNELLKNTEQLRSGQVDFIQCVQRYRRKYKKVSDKQMQILREIRSSLNENRKMNVNG